MIVTKTKPETRKLFLASELSEKAFSHAFNEWLRESQEPNYYMDMAWESVNGCMQLINETLSSSLEVVSVHGPGTEKVFPKSNASIYTGYGTFEDYGPIDEKNAWRYCDDGGLLEDMLNAYRPYGDAMRAIYDMLQRFEGNIEDPLTEAYQGLLDMALEDVSGVINEYIESSETYAYSTDHFHEWLWNVDDEQWYTEDGHLYAIRGGSYFYAIDTMADLEIVDESSPFVVTVSEC